MEDKELIEKINKFAEGCKVIQGTFKEDKYGLTCEKGNIKIRYNPVDNALLIRKNEEIDIDNFEIKELMYDETKNKIYFFSERSTIVVDKEGKIHVGIPM